MRDAVERRLSAVERERLAGYERTIERGLTTFVEVGQALLAVLDEGLYVERYGTFEAYCIDRWGIRYEHARRLMVASQVATQVEQATPPTGGVTSIPNERTARELAPVPEAERPAVWREAVERTGGKPTAAAVRAVREERAAPTAADYRGRYPVIDRESVDDAKAVEYGSYLDGLDPYERTDRLANLERTLDRRDAGVQAPEPARLPEAVDVFHRLAEAIQEAGARVGRYRGGLTDIVSDARPHVDQSEWALAMAAARDLRAMLGVLMDAAEQTPNLRSVK